MIDLLAILFKICGVIFLFAATFGLVRFSDPLQRIHASTKAGTVGAGLILMGVMIQMGGWDVASIGIATVIFLMLTIPIAGHLLGQAAYVSGARLDGMRGENALEGVLERSPLTLDEVLEQAESDALSEAKGPSRRPPQA
ncbi:monovalent cation/H(+) antiporter subunit G [Stutzerimonas tarimensis]|uniref:Monovalent cation/H(+) antiporter subunit G n=1 Tax=Stutzerimonas tarimensis TaxID=1507735 RepID=A0ABV7T736_9GAMM